MQLAPRTRVATAALAAVLGLAGCSAHSHHRAAPEPVHLVPWDGAVPSELATAHPRPAAACEAAQLRVVGPGFRFAAAAASGTASVTIRNAGRHACRLTGRPAVQLVGAPRAPKQRQTALPAAVRAFPDVTPPAGSLLALPAGAAATLGIVWSNWCVPGAAGSAKPQVPPRAVRVSLPGGRGHLDVGYDAVVTCTSPADPSTVGVRPFATAPLPATKQATDAVLRAAIQPLPGARSALVGRRGQSVSFAVRLENASSVPARFDRCPLVVEALEPSGAPEVHRLNCAAAGTIPPAGSVTLEMRIRVPARAPIGSNGLFWELDPTGTQGPEAVSRLTVTG